MSIDYSRPRIRIREDVINASCILSVMDPWPSKTKIYKSVIIHKPSWLTVLPDGIVSFTFSNGYASYKTVGYDENLEAWHLDFISGYYEPIVEAAA